MNILITGGSSGLGAAITKKLSAQSDVKIYFTYNNSLSAAKDIEENYPNTRAIQCNFKDSISVENLVNQIANLDIDVLINNAYNGITKEHFHKTSADVFLNSFQTNIIPTIKITQEGIKNFRKKKFGKIVNIISSYVLNKPPTGLSSYVANKAYLLSMSKSWAVENARFNITSNCISPSFMLTDFTVDTDERIIEQMTNENPLKKLLTTDEVAECVVFYTKSSQHINGTNFLINSASDLI